MHSGLVPFAGVLLLISLLGAGAFAQRPSEDCVAPPAGELAAPETIERGRELYNQSCTMCHGLNGTVGDRGPALAADRRYLRTSNCQLFDAIRHGIAGTLMPPTPLPESSVWQIVAYIRSLRARAMDSPVSGDVARGRRLFEGKGRCLECHMLNGRGGLIGPDLSNIGAERSLRRLREALTQPRKTIPRGYQPVRLVFADGAELRGVVKNEDNFSLQVLGVDGRLHLLLRRELREVHYEEQSLMPADYDQKLTAEEFEDLLAFLSRQARNREER